MISAVYVLCLLVFISLYVKLLTCTELLGCLGLIAGTYTAVFKYLRLQMLCQQQMLLGHLGRGKKHNSSWDFN